MNKKALFSAGAGLVALFVAIPLALAGGPRGGDGRHEPGARLERMAERLGLDAAQKQKVKVIFEQHKDEAQSLREQMRAAKDKVKAAWSDKNATPASVKAAMREVHALKAQLMEERVDLGFALKKVLTPEQFEQARHFIEGRGGRGGHGHKGFKRGGEGRFGGGPGWGGGPVDEDGPDTE